MEDVTRACTALLSLMILIRSAQTVSSPGIMQMQVEGFYNTHGRDSAGRCCSLAANTTARTPAWCPGNCRTFFRVCAAKVGPNWPDEPDLRQNTLACPLGLLVTPPIANNSLDPQQDGVLIMRFPYREWPGKVKIVLEAWHDVTGNLFTQDPRVALGAENVARLIMRLERRHRLTLNEDWLRRTVHITVPNGESSRRPVRRISITYALRIVPIPKTTPSPVTVPVTTTETLPTDNVDISQTVPEAPNPSENVETVDKLPESSLVFTTETDNTETDAALGTKINLISESDIDDADSEFILSAHPPVEKDQTKYSNKTEHITSKKDNVTEVMNSNEMANSSLLESNTEVVSNLESTGTPEMTTSSDMTNESEITTEFYETSYTMISTSAVTNNMEDTSETVASPDMTESPIVGSTKVLNDADAVYMTKDERENMDANISSTMNNSSNVINNKTISDAVNASDKSKTNAIQASTDTTTANSLMTTFAYSDNPQTEFTLLASEAISTSNDTANGMDMNSESTTTDKNIVSKVSVINNANNSHQEKNKPASELYTSQAITKSTPSVEMTSVLPLENASMPHIEQKSLLGSSKQNFKDESLVTYIYGLKLQRKEDSDVNQ